MSNYYNKTKCTTDDDYSEGDKVSVLVPKIDRCSTDMCRIPAVITNVSGGDKIKFYQITTAAGIVRNKFRSGDLKSFSGDINPDTTKEVSLREAALKVNAANRFTVSRCHCKGKCENAQCSCIRSKIKCSTHCHPGNKTCHNVSEYSSSKIKTHLDQKDVTILSSPTGWLTDKHMSVANQILQRDHPLADGLQDTLLQQNLAWQQPTSQYVQILHVNKSHWITISNINMNNPKDASRSTVYVYDSLHGKLTAEIKELISHFHQGDKIKMFVMNTQLQENGNDCGLFAIAFAKSILAGQDPTEVHYISPRMHLSSYMPIGEIPMFPTTSIPCTQKILHKDIHFPHGVTADFLDFIPEDKPKKKANVKKLKEYNLQNDYEEDIINLL